MHPTLPISSIPSNQRDNLLNTALAHIINANEMDFLKPLKIKFENEEGVDEGGVLREFYRVG